MPKRFGVVSIRIMVFFLSDGRQTVLPDVVADGAFAAGIAECGQVFGDLPAHSAGAEEALADGSDFRVQRLIQAMDFFCIPVENPGCGLTPEGG